MKIIKCKTFTAQLTIGLKKGYSEELITAEFLKQTIVAVQEQTKKQFNVVLSAKLTPCEIVCLGQDEPSVTLDFIQYPKFLVEEEQLKQALLFFSEQMMLTLEQNRVVLVFPTETLMLEQSEQIDPNIKM